MARIPAKDMNERVAKIQDILEATPGGLTVKEIVAALQVNGVTLPKSAYQSVYIVLTAAAKEGIVVPDGHKWKLLADDEEVVSVESTPIQADKHDEEDDVEDAQA